jgi:mono/diheme cytochrome c family protein
MWKGSYEKETFETSERGTRCSDYIPVGGSRMADRAFEFLLWLLLWLFVAVLLALCGPRFLQAEGELSAAGSSASSYVGQSAALANVADSSLAQNLGIEFVKGSTSKVVIKRQGKKYLVDLVTRSIREIDPPVKTLASSQSPHATPSAFAGNQQQGAALFKQNCSMCHGADGRGIASLKTPNFTNASVQASISDDQMLEIIQNGKPGTQMPAFSGKLPLEQILAVRSFVRSLGSQNRLAEAGKPQTSTAQKKNIYEPGDDRLVSLPTGRRLDRHGLYLNFAHRFPFDPAFSGTARGGALLGLDGVALPSFGLRYGITSRWTAGIYREPSLIGRPIQLSTGYNFLDEHDGEPLNLSVEFAIQGQNDFLKNYTESIEGIMSRSLRSRAQLYLVPTLSFDNRPLQLVSGYEASDILDLPGHNTFSLGVGGAVDIRPTVALLAEAIPTLVNGRPMGILRPAYSFGIQKKIWRHAFTFGFTTAPGVNVADRAGTRASFLGQSNADTPSGLFIGFDVTRQLY